MNDTQDFCNYIHRASGGQGHIPVAWFDDDWEPVGPKVRQQLVDDGLATIGMGTKRIEISLTETGRQRTGVER